jgi:PD-(D/E)XK endonuclease
MGLFGPKSNKKALGERSQAIIMYKLLEAGYNVLTPYGDNTRYDLVIEDADGQFWRVQCKTGWLDKEGTVIRFAVASLNYHTKAGKTTHGRKDYQGEVDYFTVFSPDTEKVYLIPISHTGKTEMMLRLVPAKNSNGYGVKMAADYEL